jgi:hypothetical protein
MTIDEANLIWTACYASDSSEGWTLYTNEQRRAAIDTRQQDHDRQSGTWGSWNISDRH